uniref:BLTX785 n=1 Tax=Nephila pilipes TaxID=299642 RepID=A0A076L0F2_NEPPI|nr:BLTX785 [Nephila pilipes]
MSGIVAVTVKRNDAMIRFGTEHVSCRVMGSQSAEIALRSLSQMSIVFSDHSCSLRLVASCSAVAVFEIFSYHTYANHPNPQCRL